MLIRYSKEGFQELIDTETPFVLMVYYMYQGQRVEGKKSFHDALAIYPSFVKKEDEIKGVSLPNQLVIFEEQIPKLKIMESFHHEVYDLLVELGYDHTLLWKDNDKIYQPLILGFKDGLKNHLSSYSECYCIETLTDIALKIDAGLFEPPSVS